MRKRGISTKARKIGMSAALMFFLWRIIFTKKTKETYLDSEYMAQTRKKYEKA